MFLLENFLCTRTVPWFKPFYFMSRCWQGRNIETLERSHAVGCVQRGKIVIKKREEFRWSRSRGVHIPSSLWVARALKGPSPCVVVTVYCSRTVSVACLVLLVVFALPPAPTPSTVRSSKLVQATSAWCAKFVYFDYF
jgi:hypothetical protein